MQNKILLLIIGISLSLSISGQVLFVPTGTNGIGTSGNDNVGIGTSTPDEKFEVVGVMRTINLGSAAATWDNLSLWSDGENSYIHANGDEKGLHIKSNTGGKILLESNVGIGTLLPMYSLQIQKTSANPALMIGGGYSQSPRIQTYGLDADPNAWMGLGTDMGGNSYENSIYFPHANGSGRLSIGSYNGSVYNTRMTVLEGGNVGIGTTSPSEKLEVVGVMRTINQGLATATWDNLSLWSDGENSYIHGNGDEKGLHIKSNTGGKILLESNVGIGTQNPDQMLTVKGKIHAEEVIIDLAVPADYVFKPNYKLMPLHQVEQFVKTNSHLPEIPSASEITKNGLSVGEMQNKLLQKVEELTLYAIQQNSKLQDQGQKLLDQEKKNKELELELKALKEIVTKNSVDRK